MFCSEADVSTDVVCFVFPDSLSWPLQNLGPFTVFVPVNRGFKGTSVSSRPV